MRNFPHTRLRCPMLGAVIALLASGATPMVSAGDLIQNGGFEAGTANWSGTTSVIGDWSSQQQAAYEGTKAARLGAKGSTQAQTLYQAVSLPKVKATSTLSFYLKINTKESGSTVYDTLTVKLRNSSGTVLKTLATYSNVNAGTSYQLRTFDVSSYAGQNLQIYFELKEDSSLATTFMLDKVVLMNDGSQGVPSVPQGLAASAASTSQINVTWNTVSGATGYDLQVDGVIKSGVTSPYSHTGLGAGTTHTYAVRAKNSAGTSAWSNQVSATTQTSGGSKTLYTTCVKDDLDPSDRVDFENAMKGLGYTVSGSDLNVTDVNLKRLLGRSDITMLYHTGHGIDGGIVTAGSDVLYIKDDVQSVNVTHFISATCLTMKDRVWKTKMGPNCLTTNGYTNLSYDKPIDNDVVKKYGEALAKGESYPRAWYTCNIWSSDLSDRWCTYAREASGIVEYSAVIGNVPTRGSRTALVSEGARGRVYMDENLHQLDVPVEAFAKADHQTFTRAASVRAQSPKEFLPEGMNFSQFASLAETTESEARVAADQWIQSHNLIQDTQLDKIIPVQTNLNDVTRTTGYIVRYVHAFGNLALRANGTDDHVALFVRNGRVLGFNQSWTATTRTVDTAALRGLTYLRPAEALAKASQDIARRIKGDVTFVDIKPCLGKANGATVPAYQLIDSTGASIIIHAATGAVL